VHFVVCCCSLGDVESTLFGTGAACCCTEAIALFPRAAAGYLARFVVFGSFVTATLEPNDVDIFMVMEDPFDAAQLTGEAAMLFDHAVAQAHFGASVFWLRRLAALGGEQATIEYWQVKRNGDYRGIVEIIGESP
jgi:hypothetical protein